MRNAICPECDSSDTIIIRPMDSSRQFGPGEEAHYRCRDCDHDFVGIVPEPPDEYLGDGVFADNH